MASHTDSIHRGIDRREDHSGPATRPDGIGGPARFLLPEDGSSGAQSRSSAR